MTEPVLTDVRGGVGYITLNRPKALHALNLEMCQIMHRALEAWRTDDTVSMVVVGHADGTRGFCSGGDIVMLRNSGMSDGHEGRTFFKAEYRLNAAIDSFPKPYLAIMDGVTMGGGVGISVHGSDRIATENTLFAMPETGIGLFPDVGGGWFLPRLRGELGTWLALTGARLKGADTVAAGVATRYIPAELIPNLRAQIAGADFSAGAAELLATILDQLSRPVPQASFSAHTEVINRCFSADTAEEIVARLEDEEDDWASKQADILRSKSPETVKVALRQLREGRNCETFEENMAMEYRIGWRKIQSHDFIEGVRAVVVDKDQAPSWSPERLEDVTDDAVNAYFEPLGEAELSFGP